LSSQKPEAHSRMYGEWRPRPSHENADTTDDCVFCDLTQFRAADACIENAFCLYASTRDPCDPPDVLPGCGDIIPIAHRPSPIEFHG
jgi:hypothetical protein